MDLAATVNCIQFLAIGNTEREPSLFCKYAVELIQHEAVTQIHFSSYFILNLLLHPKITYKAAEKCLLGGK